MFICHILNPVCTQSSNECLPQKAWLSESSLMDWFTTIGCFIWLIIYLGAHVSGYEGCQSPQYLELDETGIIQCSFMEGFFGLYWYNSTDTVTEEPILNLKGSARSGPGFISGEFDVHPNGSLIINHVTIYHHHEFSVVKLNTRDDHPTPHIVDVVTTGQLEHTI
ncbi:hypothetical protein HOLleu_21077 [Holothuria leucospilota]|uniref:Uncharacterized protein n=1 Tax=Holothuria leucospilota TaxID=206669 RepID=A0A9Q1BWZ6_HOLLE|nr:hypothetical protein HOLleu_21077 [Holothuria leucospilota]